MNVYKKILRPLLFTLRGETAHNLTKLFLRSPFLGVFLWRDGLSVQNERLQINAGNLSFQNPVGLAAGFDKDCEMLDALQYLGFGYIVAGSITYGPRAGNPKPRMVRYPETEALVTCMGLPNKGLDYAAGRLLKRSSYKVPVIININGFSLDEYIRCIESLQPLVDGVEISLSCSNKPEAGGDFLDPHQAEKLFAKIAEIKSKPIFIKIPTYIDKLEREKRLALVKTVMNFPFEGFTISTVGVKVDDNRIAVGSGSLSGRPLFSKMLSALKDIYNVTEGKSFIKVKGGIFSAEDAFDAIAAGASTVEGYTGFVYEGWSYAKKINLGLLELLDRYDVKNLSALRGSMVSRNDRSLS